MREGCVDDEELLRRSVLEALTGPDVLGVGTGAHLGRALDDLLDSNRQVTRALLGVEPAGTARSAGGHGGLPFDEQDGGPELD